MSSLVSQEPTLASIPESPTMTEEHRTVQDRKCQSTKKNGMKVEDPKSKKEERDQVNEK